MSFAMSHNGAMKQQFMRFTVVSSRDPHEVSDVYETLLINRDHIISIKPINMVLDGEVLKGYWIRTTNDKKYRAVEIPEELADFLAIDEAE